MLGKEIMLVFDWQLLELTYIHVFKVLMGYWQKNAIVMFVFLFYW